MKKLLTALLSVVLSIALLSSCSFLSDDKESSKSATNITATPPSNNTNSSTNNTSNSAPNYEGELNTSTRVSVPFTRQNCKKDNGYDYHVSGNTNDLQTHKRFQELVSLQIEGLKGNNSNYSIVSKNTLNCIFTLNENPQNLPRHDEAGWWNWYVNNLSNDTYAGPVYGTSIDGNQIGRGAVYFSINYTDGTSDDFFECNFLNGIDKGGTKSYTLSIDESKQLSAINIVVVYELYYEYYTNLAWYEGFANWRLSASLPVV